MLHQPFLTLLARRHASSKSPSSHKPIVLEKPTKFNPPSHPARLQKSPPRSYAGPPLSAQQREAQKTRQYPHMMPPEGSFMHWFLTNRSIHIWITLSTLTTLALFTFLSSFRQTSPFAHMLPPTSTIFRHPFAFCATYIEVFKLHTAHLSAETAERRRRKVDDVKKRSQYRKAHGMDKDEGFGGWTAKERKEVTASPIAEGGEGEEMPILAGAVPAPTLEADEDVYTDFEGRRRKPVKKWLGIW
ncbi:MAG: hypothetical protein M1817_001494 [Caeruleum heppii]|nr:MAG: hypothetical protein M1817_001494 [Caeruleum heppii]